MPRFPKDYHPFLGNKPIEMVSLDFCENYTNDDNKNNTKYIVEIHDTKNYVDVMEIMKPSGKYDIKDHIIGFGFHYVCPNNLKELPNSTELFFIISDNFNDSLNDLPNKLICLTINSKKFNQKLQNLPNNLKYLNIISTSFSQNLDTLPNSLKKLDILLYQDFRNKLNSLPNSIEELTFYHDEYGSLNTITNYPVALRILKIDHNRGKLNNVFFENLPNELDYLIIQDTYVNINNFPNNNKKKIIKNLILKNVEGFDGDKMQIFMNSYIENIDSLILEFDESSSIKINDVIDIKKHGMFPNNLKSLKIVGKKLNIDLQVLPQNLTKLVIDTYYMYIIGNKISANNLKELKIRTFEDYGNRNNSGFIQIFNIHTGLLLPNSLETLYIDAKNIPFNLDELPQNLTNLALKSDRLIKKFTLPNNLKVLGIFSNNFNDEFDCFPETLEKFYAETKYIPFVPIKLPNGLKEINWFCIKGIEYHTMEKLKTEIVEVAKCLESMTINNFDQTRALLNWD